jgi:molybdenum cofactor biosynthesis enzyme MoaA
MAACLIQIDRVSTGKGAMRAMDTGSGPSASKGAAGAAHLAPAEIAGWGPALVQADPYAPLSGALQRHGLFGPSQVAGRHWPVGCVALEITQRCNLDCRLCYLSDHAEAVRDLPLAEVFRRIDLIERHYGRDVNVQVTGGDPTLRERHELVAIVGRLAERGMRPALFTNGIKASRGLLRELAAAGLKDVAFHVDTTQGRKGYASEAALNALRRDYLERARGLGLHVLFNVTVTMDNLPEVPELVRFFIAHADAVHLVSFQLQADTGRGVWRRADPDLTQEAVIAQIEQGAGIRLGFDQMQVGHPACNRYAACLVAGGVVAPLLDDPILIAELLAQTAGQTFDRHDRRRLLRAGLKLALHHLDLWPRALAFGARKLRQLGPGLPQARGRVHKLSFYVHAFMDADRLERARCESCVFMAMTREGPVSMCVHNARRDAFTLQPVRVDRDGRAVWWDPLRGGTSDQPATAAPDPGRYPPKRLKGRLRARMLAQPAAGH